MLADQVFNLPEKVGFSVLSLVVLVTALIGVVIWGVRRILKDLREKTATLRPNGGSSVADQVNLTNSLLNDRAMMLDTLATGQHLITNQLEQLLIHQQEQDAKLNRLGNDHARLSEKIDLMGLKIDKLEVRINDQT